jgi:predicted nucleic acid-binding protein
MKIQRIYVDTSVIGGCFDPEFAEWSNGLLRDFRNGIFKALLSEVTAAEVERAPENVQAIYAELMSLNAELLAVEESALELADEYQKRGILTPNFYDDGLHIAIATVAEADLLVSWNFKHIVRFDKIRLFNAVNIEFGYKPLQIFSPREVTTYGNEEN